DLGLLAALENYIREWSHHTNVAAEFHTFGLANTRLAWEIETNLYRIAQEALNNIYKHAKASKVEIMLEKREDSIVLIIEDNGAGFDVKDKINRAKGIGLIGITERAVIIGGKSEIESREGAGTTIFVRVPVKFPA
ncbi:MAG: sensor histidine kinase, partial [Pyrinomonadaceae bacterium]